MTAVGIYIGLRSSQAAGFVQLGYVRFRNTQFVAGDRLAVNVWIKNAGGRPIENVYLVFSASLVPLNGVADEIDRQTRTGFRKQALSNYGRMLSEDQKGIALGKGEGLWDTLVLPKDSEPPLSQEQVDEIMRGRYRLYVNAWVRWKDAPHDFELCEWLQPPETNHIDNEQLIWHLCAN